MAGPPRDRLSRSRSIEVMFKKLETLFMIVGLVLTVFLFTVAGEIKNVSDSFDTQTFNNSLFFSNHNLLVTLNQMGFPLNQDFVQGTYVRYFFAVNNRLPTEGEVGSVRSAQDYLKQVGYTSSTTFDFDKAGQIREKLSQKRSFLQYWENILFIFLLLSQILTLYFSKKSRGK